MTRLPSHCGVRQLTRCTLTLLLQAILLTPASAQTQNLTVMTLNCWSGLDYQGALRMGALESEEEHETRTQALIRSLQNLRPDVVALQEVNPSHRLASRIARALDYDIVSQRVLGGIKLGLLGLPTNLNEGQAILARRDLELEFVDALLLSKGFGAVGNTISFHFAEENIALVARIRVGGGTIFIVSTHLPSDPEDTKDTHAALWQALSDHGDARVDSAALFDQLREGAQRRRAMVERLCRELESLASAAPVILLGDFNATVSSPDLAALTAAGFADAGTALGVGATWEPMANSLIRRQLNSVPYISAWEAFEAWYDGQPRRVDHIFLNRSYPSSCIRSVRIVASPSGDTALVSDHFGMAATLDLPPFSSNRTSSSFEFLPIASYDTDVGVGYGIKMFWLNMFDRRESIDVIAFNSSKGERWYRLVLSVPDFELRQGTGYAWAADVIVDYDKYLKNSFFGEGGTSQYKDRQTYTREPFEIQGLFSHSLSRRTVGQVGLRFKAVRNFNLPDTGGMQFLDPVSRGRASTFSLTASLRYDSRNSYINPSHGWVVQGDVEYAPIALGTNVRLTRFGGWLQYYVPLFYPKTILATRLGLQAVGGPNIPIQFLVPLGGGSTLRGSPQDRYLLDGIVLFNAEVRFPLIWRFGGIIGWDAGLVDAGRLTSISSGSWALGRSDASTAPRWAANSVVGLRFFMDTFLVRADIGFGEETTGFYLNFGHLF